jgi:aryl-alcohol dehydrogenase-like predicted oxidoreductase
MKISTLGIGTYNGSPSNDYDYEMFRAIADTLLSGGVNVVDTCALYRYGKS